MHALSFGQAASLYDAIRPSYPDEAIQYALGTEPVHVVDIGAGTGLLSRQLVAQGHELTVVEPDEGMLSQLRENLPNVKSHQAPAEEIPLAENSLDAAVAGQAFHWFDPDKALPEIKRVLRPGGTFAPMWNVRDESVEWVTAMSEVVGTSSADHTAAIASQPGFFGPHFEEPELKKFRHEYQINGDGLIKLMQSRSYYLTADEKGKAELTAKLEELIGTHPDLRGKNTFALPYVTYVFKMINR
ncbi:class I SAM-dependent methyltransferase [Natronoglycomyces albus]|uniref:Class I SAM-dependent methyltransferase n=1 Tax=Natronoglycomyces albus TaxID=2811108 RepID=A0A895XQ55_9ACTN|nr:class I SAM-dependent methyltransferase [Natronoglycomyces albus]QSB05673.1 class I SAM-dependent methyltransferase [Natronoglycomyces albus]